MRNRALLTIVCLLAAHLGVGHSEEGAAGPQNEEGETILVPKNPKASDIAVKTTETRWIIRLVNESLKDRPGDSRARVVLRRIYSNHPAHEGVQAYPHAVVALNDKGEPDGIERFFDVHSGCRLYRTVTWKDGKRHGEEKLFAGNQTKAIVPWADDKIHGVKRRFYPDGTLQLEAAHRDGVAEGPTRSYDPKGRLTREESKKDGKRHGMVSDYWPETGRVRRQIEYDMGKVVGVAKDYYADGQLKRELPFKNNAMHGLEIQYEADGKETRRRYWLEGKVVTAEEYQQAAN